MNTSVHGRTSLSPHGWLGVGIIVASEILLFRRVSFVSFFFTPLVWTGYILFIDSLVFRYRGSSLIFHRTGEFALLLPLSIGFWLIFEYYNLFIRNWYYVGLPDDFSWRLLGYVWAFATIWPAILQTAQALEAWGPLARSKIRPRRIDNKFLITSLLFGAFCLTFPFIASPPVAKYLAGPVWVGFIFFLDPLNYWMGGRSLFRDLEKGDPRTLYSLLLSGLICGFLWEFWNYWAGGKWHYTVPILENVKVFEMPVLGYLGFPPFAVECYTMYAFIRNILFREKVADG